MPWYCLEYEEYRGERGEERRREERGGGSGTARGRGEAALDRGGAEGWEHAVGGRNSTRAPIAGDYYLMETNGDFAVARYRNSKPHKRETFVGYAFFEDEEPVNMRIEDYGDTEAT